MREAKHPVEEIAETIGGKIESMGKLPDGSGFAIMSSPLPKDHWLYADNGEFEPPPMPFRMNHNDPRYRDFHDKARAAARQAIRAATLLGKEPDFDPDALVQCFLVALFGYHTEDGLSDDKWANPDPIPPLFP